MYVTITIVVIIVIMVFSAYGYIKEEMKMAKLKQENKELSESLRIERQKNTELQKEIIGLKQPKKKVALNRLQSTVLNDIETCIEHTNLPTGQAGPIEKMHKKKESPIKNVADQDEEEND